MRKNSLASWPFISAVEMGELTWNKHEWSQNITQDKINSKSDLSIFFLGGGGEWREGKEKRLKGCISLSFDLCTAACAHRTIAAATNAFWRCVLVKGRWTAKPGACGRCRCLSGAKQERSAGAPVAARRCRGALALWSWWRALPLPHTFPPPLLVAVARTRGKGESCALERSAA